MPEVTIEQLQQENAALQAEVADLKSTNEALAQVNEDLSQKIEELSEAAPAEPEEAKAPVIPADSFKVGKRSFKFITPVFFYEGTRTLAQDAIHDKALLEKLVERQVGVIQEL